MNRSLFTRIALSALSALSSLSYARILNVPDDYQTIQAGIDAAEEGDTVLVAPGIYSSIRIRPGIVIGSKILTTGDLDYIDSTIIDGDDHRCVVGNGYLRGFIIRNGAGYTEGTGIWTTNGLFEDLVVTGCITSDQIRGGAVYVSDGGSARFVRCRIIANGFRDGHFSRRGGGLTVANSYTDVGAEAILVDCEISENRANVGGGIYASPNSIIRVDHCLIAQNYGSLGSAIYLNRTILATFNNVTFSGNIENGDNCGVIGGVAREISIENSICFHNPTQYTVQSTYENMSIDYSDFEGGIDRFVQVNDLNYGRDNIEDDPRFVDQQNGNYSLSPDSPCIDAGDPNSPPDPDDTRADMGAFYFRQNMAPEIIAAIADLDVDEDCDYLAIADLDSIFSDPDGDTLVYEYNSLEPLGLTLDEDNVLGLNPQDNFYGDSLIVIVTARDRDSEVPLEFFVTILPVNDLPSNFALVSPEDDFEFMFNDTVTFVWNRSDDPDEGEMVGYLFHLERWWDYSATEIDSLWVISNGGETSLTIPDPAWDVSWPDYGCMQAPYTWWVEAISAEDTTRCDSTYSLLVWGSGEVKERGRLAENCYLLSAFPNPFNSSTTISYTLPKAGWTVMDVVDVNGRLVQRLSNGWKEAGSYRDVFDCGGLATGQYLLKLQGTSQAISTPLTIIK